MKTAITYMALTLNWLCLSAATWQVGPGRTYVKPSQVTGLVADGDVVEIDAGEYVDAAKWDAGNLTIRGMGGFAHVKDIVYGSKAIWVVNGNNVTIENIEFSGAKIGSNAAGIRAQGGDIYIRRCYFHHNENGILCLTDNPSAEIVIEHSEFHDNGNQTLEHNMYIGVWRKFTLKHCYSHDVAGGGQLVKTRALENHILYNRITDEGSNSLYPIVIQNGGVAYIIGNLIQNRAGGDNKGIIDYGSGTYQSARLNPDHRLYVVNNTIVNDHQGFTHGIIDMRDGHLVEAKIINNLIVGAQESQLVWFFPNEGIDTQDYPERIADTNNLFTTAPAFEDMANFNYKLTAGSPAVDAGIDPGFGGTVSLFPGFQYVHPVNGDARPVVGALDIGAYEYDAPTSIVDQQGEASVLIYPNPTTGELRITNEELRMKNAGFRLSTFDFRLYDLYGKVVLENQLPTTNYQLLDLSHLPAGVYFLTITTVGGSGTVTEKIVKY